MSSTSVPEILTRIRDLRDSDSFRSRDSTVFNPSPGNPRAFNIACCRVSRITLGVAFPGRASRVTVPPVAKPKPISRRPGRKQQSLSNPAATPTGLGNVMPETLVSRRASRVARNGRSADQIGDIRSAKSPIRCAVSGGNRKRNGLATALYRPIWSASGPFLEDYGRQSAWTFRAVVVCRVYFGAGIRYRPQHARCSVI